MVQAWPSCHRQVRGVPACVFIVDNSANEGTVRAFAQDQAAGEPVVDGAFAGRKADAEAIDQEIVAAHNGYQRQEASTAEPQAGAPEIDWIACAVGYVDSQEALSESCMPVGTLRESIVEPALDCEEAEADEKKSRSGLRESVVKRCSRTMIEEGIRDSRGGSEKRDEDCEGDNEKNQIDDCGDETNPEACVW